MIRLHGYWRSGAAWRVRIALALKNLDPLHVMHDLRRGEQHAPDFAALNPQQLIPALEADGVVLTQSLAILEWLEESYPAHPILPSLPTERALVRAMAGIVCCDIHPLGNLRVQGALREYFAASEDDVRAWLARWISDGFAALETLIADHGGRFAFGNSSSITDCCLVPQVNAARRLSIPMNEWPCIAAVADHCDTLDAFARAHASAQPDAD